LVAVLSLLFVLEGLVVGAVVPQELEEMAAMD
jgi:uncharacterized protein YjeT (DUF2065 family)